MIAVVATPNLAGGAATWTEKREAERILMGPQRCTPNRERCSNVQAAQPEPRGLGCRFRGSSGNPCLPSRTGRHQGQTEARWGRLPPPVQMQQRSGSTRSQSAVQLQPTCAGPPQLDTEHLSFPDIRTHSSLLHLENIQIFSKFMFEIPKSTSQFFYICEYKPLKFQRKEI